VISLPEVFPQPSTIDEVPGGWFVKKVDLPDVGYVHPPLPSVPEVVGETVPGGWTVPRISPTALMYVKDQHSRLLRKVEERETGPAVIESKLPACRAWWLPRMTRRAAGGAFYSSADPTLMGRDRDMLSASTDVHF
jgi:hypothetical protein